MKTHYVIKKDGLYVLMVEKYRGILHPQAVISASRYLSTIMRMPWGTHELPDFDQVDFSEVE